MSKDITSEMLEENTSKEQNFASRYIVDVSITPSYILLADSSRAKFYIDGQNKKCIDQFQKWFKNVFSEGISGKLTLFAFKKVEHDGQFVNVIDYFLKSSLIAKPNV